MEENVTDEGAIQTDQAEDTSLIEGNKTAGSIEDKDVRSIEEGIQKAREFLGEELSEKYFREQELKGIDITTEGRQVWNEWDDEAEPTGKLLHVTYEDGSEIVALKRKAAITPIQRMGLALSMHTGKDISGRQWQVDALASWDGKNKVTTEVRERADGPFTHAEYVTENGNTTITTSKEGEFQKTEEFKGEFSTSIAPFVKEFRNSIAGRGRAGDSHVESFAPRAQTTADTTLSPATPL